MKYYVYSFLWKSPQMNQWSSGTGLHESKTGIIGLYEMAAQQPGLCCITHAQEITKAEYDKANIKGIIG